MWTEIPVPTIQFVITKHCNCLSSGGRGEGNARLVLILTNGSAFNCGDCKMFWPMSYSPFTARPAPQWEISSQDFRPLPFYSRKRAGTHCIGGWVGPRALLDEREKNWLPTGFDPRIFQPVASRHTDWAIPAQYFLVTKVIHMQFLRSHKYVCVTFVTACVCIYIYIYIYTHTHTYIHTHTHTHIPHGIHTMTGQNK